MMFLGSVQIRMLVVFFCTLQAFVFDFDFAKVTSEQETYDVTGRRNTAIHLANHVVVFNVGGTEDRLIY